MKTLPTIVQPSWNINLFDRRVLSQENRHTEIETQNRIEWERKCNMVCKFKMILFELKTINCKLHWKETGAPCTMVFQRLWACMVVVANEIACAR